MGDGLNERSGRFLTWLAGRLRADLSTCSKRGLCWPRASRNGERQWAGGSVATASSGVDPDRCRSGRRVVFGLNAVGRLASGSFDRTVKLWPKDGIGPPVVLSHRAATLPRRLSPFATCRLRLPRSWPPQLGSSAAGSADEPACRDNRAAHTRARCCRR